MAVANGSGGDGYNACCDAGVGKKGATSTQLASCVEKGEGMAGAILHVEDPRLVGAYALLASVVGQTPTSANANTA